MVNLFQNYIYQKPLSELIHKNIKFEINEEIINTINTIKSIINADLYLLHPDFNRQFYVITDASIHGIGGMLGQFDNDDILKPVEFASHIFNPVQKRWHVSEQELYAIVYFVEKWSYYLIGRHFNVYTDHKNLQTLFNKAKNFKTGKLFRWTVRLQEFDFTCHYIPGKDNYFCDYLSRDALTDNVNISEIDYENDNNNKTHDILTLYIQHLCEDIINNKNNIFVREV